jgi:hypothetical protein
MILCSMIAMIRAYNAQTTIALAAGLMLVAGCGTPRPVSSIVIGNHPVGAQLPQENHSQKNTGVIRGIIRYATPPYQPLAGVTVVATTLLSEGSEASITDEDGSYAVTRLVSGTYLLTLYYGDVTVEIPSVRVESGKTIRVNRNLKVP